MNGGRPKSKPGLARRIFRAFRIACLFLLLLIAAVLLWANYVRVPDSITARVKDELRRHNLALDFSRLRLRGMHRLVAENVSLHALNAVSAPVARVSEAELVLDYQQLLSGDLRLSGLRIQGGSFSLPAASRAGRARSLQITNVQAGLQFVGTDSLRITGLSGEGLGAKVMASGRLRHLSEFQKNLQPKPKPGARPWDEELAEILDLVEEVHFATPPEMHARFSIDAANIAGTRASLLLKAGRTATPWNEFASLRLASGIYPVESNRTVHALLALDASGLRNRDQKLDAIHAEVDSAWTRDLAQLLTNRIIVSLTNIRGAGVELPNVNLALASSQKAAASELSSVITLNAAAFKAGDIRASASSLSATVTHAMPFPSPAVFLKAFLSTNAVPAADLTPQAIGGEWRARLENVRTPSAQVDSISVSGSLKENDHSTSGVGVAFWNMLPQFDLSWKGALSNAVVRGAAMGSFDLDGTWDSPRLAITRFSGRPCDGSLEAQLGLDTESRMLSASADAQFDYKQAAALFGPEAGKWLEQISWEQPPRIHATFSAELPGPAESWTNFGRLFLSTLRLDGGFSGAVSYRGIPFDNLEGQLGFADGHWTISDFVITRPEGQAFADLGGDFNSLDFFCKLNSQVDPGFIKNFLPEDQQIAFDVVKFAKPPVISGELHGNFAHPDRIGFSGSLTAKDFFVKEQAFSDVSGEINYTNLIVEAAHVVAHRGKEELTVPYLRVDIPGEVMFVTNGVSTIDPWVAMSLVGDDAYDAIDPYRFATSPTVTINGNVPLRHWSKANLHFGVSGTEFTFWRFHLPSVAGDVYWKADHLNLSNVVANFYGGQAQWSGAFFIDHHHAIYSFTGITTNTDVKPLVRDIFAVTNQVEGTLSGRLVITSANSADPKSWDGYGEASLRDGFLWKVPVFGVFSPIIDSVAPGLGSNPISSGGGSFEITNSVVYTRDLQVRAPAFRLDYRGKVDSEGNLDARVEAEILRDTWVVGKLFSVALWPVAKAFEARVTGTVQDPKTKPRFFPAFVFAPFKVLNAIGEAVKNKKTDATAAQPPLPGPVPGNPR
jgi:hypothetical protein